MYVHICIPVGRIFEFSSFMVVTLSTITEMKGGGYVVRYVVPLVCGFRDNIQAWCQLFANLYELESRVWFCKEHNQ